MIKMSQQLNIQIIKTNRNSLSLEVTPKAEVIVRAPNLLPDSSIQKFIQKKWFWLNNHVLKAKKQLAILNSKTSNEEKNVLSNDELNLLRIKASIVIKQKVEHFASLLGVTYNNITIKSQISRWGSCSAKGNLNFNCLLMLAPAESIDYVVIHELCHRKEMNHSNKFWALVEKYMPDYAKHRKWLKDNGANLIAKLGKK